MMNPYELNWPGLRDVPVVTIDTDASIIYSQENLLPLKRGKLDRLEYKYVPIEAVLDEFNAEIELEEAFETLESILDIPGVKPLYTDKPTGRKYVHVSSLLALIVLRPEDGPGFETACHSILHFLMNHLEMACLECGFIRRDCLCQVYEVCLEPKNIECVGYAKESAEKDVQTDPINPGYAAGFPVGNRSNTTTVFLPPGANLANCERLPDGRLNIKYMKGDGKGDAISHPQPAVPGIQSHNMMLPPESQYLTGTTTGHHLQAGFMPPSTVPVCHTGGMGMNHPAMVGPGGYLPLTTSPLSMMSTMLPTNTLRHMGPAMYGSSYGSGAPMYPGVQTYYPGHQPHRHYTRCPMPPPVTPKSNNGVQKSNNGVQISNNGVAKSNNGVSTDKSKPMKRGQGDAPEEPRSILKKRRRESLLLALKDGKETSADGDDKEKRKKAGRQVNTLTKNDSEASGEGKEKSEKGTDKVDTGGTEKDKDKIEKGKDKVEKGKEKAEKSKEKEEKDKKVDKDKKGDKDKARGDKEKKGDKAKGEKAKETVDIYARKYRENSRATRPIEHTGLPTSPARRGRPPKSDQSTSKKAGGSDSEKAVEDKQDPEMDTKEDTEIKKEDAEKNTTVDNTENDVNFGESTAGKKPKPEENVDEQSNTEEAKTVEEMLADAQDRMDTTKDSDMEPETVKIPVPTECATDMLAPLDINHIKTEIEDPPENASYDLPEEAEMATAEKVTEAPKSITVQVQVSATTATDLFNEQKALDISKGWDVFEYAPTGQKMIRCLCCGQCFDHEKYADKHKEMHTVQRSLRCLECEYTVSAARWYTLLRHLYSKHNTAFVEEENSCKLCGNVFATTNELEEHVDVHHYNKYKCTYCGTSLLTWDAYKHHVDTCLQVAQGKTYYSCPYCHFAFRDRLMKQVHIKSHQDDALVCCYCRDGKDWGNWKMLKQHYELLHLPKVKDRNPKKAKACPQCTQVFKSYKGFRNHVAKCTGPKPKVIPEVKDEKVKDDMVTDDVVLDDKTKDVKDDSAKDDMVSDDKIKEDKLAEDTITEEKPTDKVKDGSETETSSEKKDEKDKAEKEDGDNKAKVGDDEDTKENNDIKTKDVDMDGKKPKRRRKRMMKQKGPVKCEKCPKKFGAMSTLDRHMSYAHGSEAKCDECDHVAKTPMLLKMHKTLKHSDKRHICSECNRTFMYYHQYKVHLAWHARKVAYACPTCDTQFPRQMELRQHQLTEHPTVNNRTVFTCSGCDFKCFSRTTLRAHLRNKHLSSDEEGEEEKEEEDELEEEEEDEDTDEKSEAPEETDHDEKLQMLLTLKDERSNSDHSDEKSDSATDTDSDVAEEDLQKMFSWRQSRPAPEGARRSQRTPKPSTKLRDIARMRKLSQRGGKGKGVPPSKKGRRKRSVSPRRAPTPPPPPVVMRRRRPGMKGRPPKRVLKARRMKKEKVEKKVKLRRCGCARFRTYAEFKILKKRLEDKRIVETTIVEDATLPMRRRMMSQESEPEVIQPPVVEAPSVSWSYETSLSSGVLSVEQQQQLYTLVLDHAYYQKPGPPPTEIKNITSMMVGEADGSELEVGSTTVLPGGNEIANMTSGSFAIIKDTGIAGMAVQMRRKKRLSSSGPAVTSGQSPSKVRATVNDLESAIKFADNINQLSKLVSILRADKEELPTTTATATTSSMPSAPAAVTGTPGNAIHTVTAASFLQSPPRTRLVPINAGGMHITPNRVSISDYEIGDIEPLPSDIMASEMESDIDMQGVMSEILEEMGQAADDSGVSQADVSQAAEVLLSLDMSAEERELVSDPAQNGGILFTTPSSTTVAPVTANTLPPVSVEYMNNPVNDGTDNSTATAPSSPEEEEVDEASLMEAAVMTLGNMANGGQSLEEQEDDVSEEQSPEEEMILHDDDDESVDDLDVGDEPEATAEIANTVAVGNPAEDTNRFVIKTVALGGMPKVAVEMTNVNLPQTDFLYWAAKHDDSDDPQMEVLAPTQTDTQQEEVATITAECKDEQRTTWQLDHQYF